MSWFRAAFARLTGLVSRHDADDDLRAELESHLEMEIDEFVRRGMSPAEARRQAMIASGGVTQAAESVRERRGIPFVSGLAGDVRYALRSLRHAKAFSGVVIVTLALGIGANTAIFSVVRAVLLKPLPHHEGDRLVYLRQRADGPGRDNLAFSVPEVRELRRDVATLDGIAEHSEWSVTLLEEHGATRLDAGLVTGNFFEVMGLRPIIGRTTTAADDGGGVPPVMVLTHGFWQQHFGGDSSIVGRQLRLRGATATVIGVLQPAPFFPSRVDVLMNMSVSPHHVSASMVEGRTHRMTEVIARLGPDATVDLARLEVEAAYTRMQSAFADAYDKAANQRVEVIPFRTALGEGARLTLFLLVGAAGFVLVISAANVINLTLMRGVRRTSELVVRTALGAGVGRLRRLLMAENLLLTVAGASAGVAVAVGGLGLLRAFTMRYSPRAAEIQLDLTALTFAAMLAFAMALLLSLVAALPSEGTLAGWIAAGMQRISGGLRKQRLQRLLVVTQVAVSVMLLAGAGLLTRTMLQLSAVETGLATEEVLTIPVPLLDPTRISSQADAANKVLYQEMKSQVAALPGVVSVGVGSAMPLRGSSLSFEFKVEGKAPQVGEAKARAELRTADPDYFGAAGIPLLAGRAFAATDMPGAGRVVLINKTFADRFFAGEDPIGKRIAYDDDILRFTPFSGDWRTIVGVVGDTRDGGLDAAPRAVTYLPFAQEFAVAGGLVIRAERDVAALTAEATRIVRRLAPQVPLENVLTVRQIKAQSVTPRRLNAVLVSSFAMLAALVAAVGIAGVLAFSVSARTTEIGIRMSLGAQASQVQRMVLGEGGRLLAIGLAIGIAGAALGARAIRGLLFGVAPHDPLTLVAVAMLMALIGVVACWLPARRAAQVDPAITMRS